MVDGHSDTSNRGASREQWEQRWHPLRREWVVVAGHRDTRPWHGETERAVAARPPAYDPACPLCPGNARAHGQHNPDYRGVYVFDNDYPVVSPSAPASEQREGGGDAASASVYRRRPARGVARVLCYDPRHNVHLADLPVDVTCQVLRAWREQDRELCRRPGIRHLLFFENRGESVGVSNPHPHCQLYAVDFIFRLIEIELEACRAYGGRRGGQLFDAILEAELTDGRRILVENDSGVAFVPFFARYAYEVMIVPRSQRLRLSDLTDAEVDDLARLLHRVVCLYDALFAMPFPYVLALHQAPFGCGPDEPYRLHLEIQPPLRRPGLKKFLAGPEIGGGNFMSDTWPEAKAAELRAAAGGGT